MRKRKIINKKYVIRIFGARFLHEELFDMPNSRYAFIICSIRAYKYSRFIQSRRHAIIDFKDTLDRNDPLIFSKEDAKKIKKFILGLPNEVTDLFICCDWGQSRSPAVAAAVLLASGKSDSPIWNNPNYRPNWYVFRLLCGVFGTNISRFQLSRRIIINSLVKKWPFKKWNKHELWEIL